MKKIATLLLVLILSYLCWPLYQGLAYKDMLPLIGFNFVAWPTEQPSSSQLFAMQFEHAEHKAITALKKQQAKVAAPGYTAAVAIDGAMIWAGSVGWADISQHKKMTTDTQLRIGSTSKALTATGLARLVADDKLDLDAPLSSYFKVLPNQAWANITARQLASHMAGIPHYQDNTELLGVLETITAQTYYPDVMEAITLFDESETLFKPGEQFSYSSLGSVLLSALMQVKAQQTYQDYMQQAVFKPLKMTATFTETPTSNRDNLATFYWQNSKQLTELKAWYQVDLSHRLAGGGWVSTSTDLAKLGQGFMDDTYIPQSVREEFWTPQVLSNGDINAQKYGLGWRVHNLELGESFTSMKYMHHGGVSAGAQSFLMVIPEYKLSIAVNANARTAVFSDFANVSFDLARIFIQEIETQ